MKRPVTEPSGTLSMKKSMERPKTSFVLLWSISATSGHESLLSALGISELKNENYKFNQHIEYS